MPTATINTVAVTLKEVDIVNLNVSQQMTKTPVLGVLEKFWNGTKEAFQNFISEFIDLGRADNLQNVDEVISFSNHCFKKLETMNGKKGDLGQLDYRLAAVFKARYLTPFSADDLKTLVFDISGFDNPEARAAISEIFMQCTSTAFIEFKEVSGNFLYYTYSKKALMEDGSRLTIATSRERVNIAEDYKSIKDANFVSSKLILEMAKKMSEMGLAESSFRTKLVTPNYVFDKTYTVTEILKYSSMSLEDKLAKQRAEEIREVAKQELQDEKNLTRASLDVDSTKQVVSNIKPEIRVETNASFLAKANYKADNFVDSLFDEYQQKELEKTKLRMERAQKDGAKAYATLKANMANGLPILEAIRATKQEFRDEETIMFASLMLTKDVLDAMDVQAKMTDLKTEILQKDNEIAKIAEQIAKKEDSIKEHQAATARKSNELNILREEYQKNIADMQNETKSKLADLQKEYNTKIEEANGIIDEQSKIIDRLQTQIGSTDKLFGESKDEARKLNVELNSLRGKVSSLESQNESLSQENEKLKKSSDELKELQIKEKFLNDKIKELQGEVGKKDEMIERLFAGSQKKERKEEPKVDTRRVNDILKGGA